MPRQGLVIKEAQGMLPNLNPLAMLTKNGWCVASLGGSILTMATLSSSLVWQQRIVGKQDSIHVYTRDVLGGFLFPYSTKMAAVPRYHNFL